MLKICNKFSKLSKFVKNFQNSKRSFENTKSFFQKGFKSLREEKKENFSFGKKVSHPCQSFFHFIEMISHQRKISKTLNMVRPHYTGYEII